MTFQHTISLPTETHGTQLYAVLDSVRIPELLRQIYEHDESPVARNLYQGTELDNLHHLAPWVVQVHPESRLPQWLENTVLPEAGGYLFSSNYGIEEIVQHWSWLRHVWGQGNQLSIGRLHDPDIMTALMQGSEPQEQCQLMGVADRLWVYSRRQTEWQIWQNEQPAFIAQTDFYRLSDRQITHMAEVPVVRLAQQLAEHIRTYFPDRLETDPQAQAERYIQQARALQFNTRQDQYRYTNILCRLGEEPVRQGRYPEIHRLLTQSSAQTPSQRLAQAAELASQMVGNKV